MIRIAFVCHGNICRSPMAEFLFRKKIKELNLQNNFHVESFGTSFEEEGNPVYPPVRQILNNLGIDCSKKRAQTITRDEYENFDYFLCMDSQNKRNLMRIFGQDKDGKVYKLLDFTSIKGDVADPYYYGGFEEVYKDIEEGNKEFIKFLIKKEKAY